MGWVSCLEDIQKAVDANEHEASQTITTATKNISNLNITLDKKAYRKLVGIETSDYLFDYYNNESDAVKFASELLLRLRNRINTVIGLKADIFCLSERLPVSHSLEYCFVFTRECFSSSRTQSLKNPKKVRNLFISELAKILNGKYSLCDDVKTGVTKIQIVDRKYNFNISFVIIRETKNKDFDTLRFGASDRRWFWEYNANSKNCFSRFEIIEKNKRRELVNIFLAYKKLSIEKLNKMNFFSSMLSMLNLFKIEYVQTNQTQ